jgi:hypothetical protein
MGLELELPNLDMRVSSPLIYFFMIASVAISVSPCSIPLSFGMVGTIVVKKDCLISFKSWSSSSSTFSLFRTF